MKGADRMTGEEKYLKGREMEKDKRTVDEIVRELGYKDRNALYAARNYYRGKELTQRAAACKEQHPEPAPILEGLRCVDKVPVKPAPSVDEKPAGRLKVTTQLTAQGAALCYRWADGRVSIRRKGGKSKAMLLTPDEVVAMIAELNDLFRQAGRS
jgi:hypothetical protein